MKATGVVRRIDDLGRVVIPKEIRRTMRIREGEPLEIFVDRDGEVILKKYSPIGELGEFGQEYVDSLTEVTGHIACILDNDAVVAVSGTKESKFIDKPISDMARKVIDEQEIKIINQETDNIFCEGIYDEEDSKFFAQVLAPIIVAEEAIGAVVLASQQERAQMEQLEEKLANTAAGFLAKQMDK
ncbi:stage V sporulation protein T [Halanaerobacter jeridensis]|uniref:AbrB family transcriptional regulator (Stage V sporulation protein T) n=1 Tax=Halanaerobacter jeridensis TaxID=706427 RepID=A0A938XPM0_9FIRM|nr:stage V sporulation protein T [Halanaerobacter jeridensis]MBM7557203.1 AbrB family transcriptional regulator (stage V sporulation protein T) [Halanaerobacter jeridensis]